MFDFLRWDMFDSPSFIGAAKELFGLEGGYNFQSRLSKPLALLIPGALEYLFTIPAQTGFILQSIAAFYACAFVFRRIVYRLTQNEKLAFYGMLLYVTCQPFAIFSLMILVDGLGWLISLFIIDQLIRIVQSDKMKWQHWILFSGLSALGMLIKESVIFAFIFLLVYAFLQPENIGRKIARVIYSSATFLLIFLLTQWITESMFSDSIIGRLGQQQDGVGFIYYNKENIAQLFRVVDFYWLLVGVGLWELRKSIKHHTAKSEIIALSLALIASLILMPIHPYVVDRILFMIAPALLTLAVLSHRQLKRYFLPLIILGGILNVCIAYFIYRYNTHNILFYTFILYSSAVIFALWRNRKTASLKIPRKHNSS